MNDIVNFRRISDTLATSGQPRPEEFAAIRAAGFEVVINLAVPTSRGTLTDESKLVAAQGMEYVAIPVKWDNPTAADLDRFFETMDRCQNRKVFVHCALNMRVSSFVFLYRVIRQKVPIETARAAMLKLWQPEGKWADFIHDSLVRYGVDVPKS